MRQYPYCSVSTSDDVHPPLDKALVVAIGESPNATVRFAARVDDRWATVDRLTEATIDAKKGKTVKITGLSEHLLDRVGVAERDEARITITLSPSRGCKDC